VDKSNEFTQIEKQRKKWLTKNEPMRDCQTYKHIQNRSIEERKGRNISGKR
jgi:hypothetical protein